jgi:hypothetical protein
VPAKLPAVPHDRPSITVANCLMQVDAPESKQTCVNNKGQSYACGLVSKDALAQKVGNQVRADGMAFMCSHRVPISLFSAAHQLPARGCSGTNM